MRSERGVVDFERRPSNEQRRVENGGAEDDEDGAGDDADKTEAKAPEKRNIFFLFKVCLCLWPRSRVRFPERTSRLFRLAIMFVLYTHAYSVLVVSNNHFIGGIFG